MYIVDKRQGREGRRNKRRLNRIGWITGSCPLFTKEKLVRIWWQTISYTTVYSRVRWSYIRRISSYTTRRDTPVILPSSNITKYDRNLHRIQLFTTVVMLVLGILLGLFAFDVELKMNSRYLRRIGRERRERSPFRTRTRR